jgi:hypothetical protein
VKAGKTLLDNPSELRFAARWLYSLLPWYSPLEHRQPWVNFRAIEWLDSYLQPSMCVFEYGSGGSTLFLAERVAHVVSVEHDKGFHHLLTARLQRYGVTNCTYRLCAPAPIEASKLPPYSCASFTSEWPTQAGMSFEAYVKTIDDYPDGSFDLVTVDGRARPSCVLRALPKIKNGGWLFADNMERPRYQLIRDLLAQYESIEFFGVVPSEVRPQRSIVWKIVAN